jgi:hypothetical protein
MCHHRPCYGTPVEIWRIIKAGYGEQLMVDWWDRDGELPYIEIICPAIVGSEQQMAPKWPVGRCALHTPDELCPLHKPGLKPREGRLVMHDYCPPGLHKDMVKTWNTWMGRKIVELWKKRFSIDRLA